MSESGSSRSVGGRARCPECGTGNALSASDKHSKCFLCLGPRHRMGDCEFCLQFAQESQHRRAERLHLWREAGGSDEALPSIAEVKEWGANNIRGKRKAWLLLTPSATPHRERFSKFEGSKGEVDHSSEEDEESEEDAGAEDQGSPQEGEG